MIHVPIQTNEITEENLQQTCESMVLARKVSIQHWETFFSDLHKLFNEHGVPPEEQDEAIDFAKHCINVLIQTISHSSLASAALASWCTEGDRAEHVSQMMRAMKKASERVDAVTTEEDATAIMAEWDLSELVEEVEDELAMETGSHIPPSVERQMRSFIRSIFGSEIPDEEIQFEPVVDPGEGTPFGIAMVAMPDPQEYRARRNKKRLEGILGEISVNTSKKEEKDDE